MKLSTWRPLIKTYFNTLLQPTGWFVDTPPDTVLKYATLPPIGNVSFEYKPPYEVMAMLSQELYYFERVSNEQWHNIPLPYYEGLYGQVAYQILTDSKTLHPDILSISFSEFGRQEEVPVATEALADGWLVSLRWSFKSKVLLSPEVPDTVIPIESITTELWTNLLSDNTFQEQYRVLDSVITESL